MRNFYKHTDSSNEAQQDMLPALPVRLPFLWTRTSKLKEVWDIVRTTRLWPGLAITADSTALCFTVNGFPMARLGWDGRLDLPFGQEVLDEIMVVETAGRNSDRAVFQVQTHADVDRAIGFLRLAYLAVDSKSPLVCS
jgi:hypothetical protein